MTHIVDLS